MRIALATTRPLPEPDPDEPLLVDALRRAGHDPVLLPWTTGEVTDAPLVLLRSTWDYHLAPDAFRAWLMRTSARSRLVNPLRTVLGNLHKGYLLDLAARGVPIVPTTLVKQGIPPVETAFSCEGAFVVKPAIGASSWNARSFKSEADAREYVQVLGRDMDVLIQPFQKGEESSLVWIAGEFTHKVTKSPRFEGGEESVSDAQAPTDQERAVATQALETYLGWTGERALYARVDLIGGFVSEVELIEPSLFFLQQPSALERFVFALGGWLPPVKL